MDTSRISFSGIFGESVARFYDVFSLPVNFLLTDCENSNILPQIVPPIGF